MIILKKLFLLLSICAYACGQCSTNSICTSCTNNLCTWCINGTPALSWVNSFCSDNSSSCPGAYLNVPSTCPDYYTTCTSCTTNGYFWSVYGGCYYSTGEYLRGYSNPSTCPDYFTTCSSCIANSFYVGIYHYYFSWCEHGQFCYYVTDNNCKDSIGFPNTCPELYGTCASCISSNYGYSWCDVGEGLNYCTSSPNYCSGTYYTNSSTCDAISSKTGSWPYIMITVIGIIVLQFYKL